MVENITMTFKPTSQVPFPLPLHFVEAIGLAGDNRAQAIVNAVKDAVEKSGGMEYSRISAIWPYTPL